MNMTFAGWAGRIITVGQYDFGSFVAFFFRNGDPVAYDDYNVGTDRIIVRLTPQQPREVDQAADQGEQFVSDVQTAYPGADIEI